MTRDEKHVRAILSVDVGRTRKRQYLKRAQQEGRLLSQWVMSVLDAEVYERVDDEDEPG
jgi:hypothetical protein